MYSVTVGLSPVLCCRPTVTTIGEPFSGNPFKCHEEVLYLQPMTPAPKRFDFSPPDWGILRRPRRVQIFLESTRMQRTRTQTAAAAATKYLCFVFVWCSCMAINVIKQHNGGFLPGIILLTQCYYYHRGGTRLNDMKRFCICSL